MPLPPTAGREGNTHTVPSSQETGPNRSLEPSRTKEESEMNKRTIPAILLVLVVGLFSTLLPAQSPPGILGGVVLGPNNRPVPRALVRLESRDGAEIERRLSGPNGKFQFTGLSEDTYRIEVTLTGFETFTEEFRTGTKIEIVLTLAPVQEQIVVTATRTGAPTSQIGANTWVYSEEEIRGRQAATVSDLLRSMPGVAVVRTGGHGALTSLFVRGAESNHNKILLDGVPLNGPGGEFFLSNLTTENIERVEVIRGPQSALFGSDAMGDVVQLFTRRTRTETGRPNIQLSFEAGNQDTWHGVGGLAGKTGRFDYSAQWSRFFTDNREVNSTFHNTSLSGNFGYELNQTTTLRVILRGEFGQVGTPDATAFQAPDLTALSRRRAGTGAVTLHDQTRDFWEQRLTYGFNETRMVSQDLIADKLFDFLFDSLDTQKRHHLNYQSDFRAGSVGNAGGQHHLTFAFEWDGERGFFGDRLDPDSVANAKRDNIGWVFQHQALWNRFSLTTGVRFEDNDSFGFAAAPRISAAYFLRTGGGALGSTKLKGNFGLGIKEPTFVESFSRNFFFLGNPNLQEERSRSFDAGVEQRFWYDRAKLEVNLFHNRFRDLIQFQIVDFTTFEGSFFNVQRAKAKGAEIALEVAPTNGLRTRGTYTLLDSKSSATERPLLRRPRQSGTLEVFWDWRRLSVNSTILFVGKREDSSFLAPGQTSNPRYTRWDLGWSYRSSYRVTWFGVVENLLNDDYMEALGFPALKIMFRAGARVEF